MLSLASQLDLFRPGFLQVLLHRLLFLSESQFFKIVKVVCRRNHLLIKLQFVGLRSLTEIFLLPNLHFKFLTHVHLFLDDVRFDHRNARFVIFRAKMGFRVFAINRFLSPLFYAVILYLALNVLLISALISNHKLDLL